ncbi:MAG: hypothetical protein QOE47_486, partial [Pyrinomonadaceae bacterium]|nr:hypothetical protein [Pyrinomonadaceae bacterium]
VGHAVVGRVNDDGREGDAALADVTRLVVVVEVFHFLVGRRLDLGGGAVEQFLDRQLPSRNIADGLFRLPLFFEHALELFLSTKLLFLSVDGLRHLVVLGQQVLFLGALVQHLAAD